MKKPGFLRLLKPTPTIIVVTLFAAILTLIITTATDIIAMCVPGGCSNPPDLIRNFIELGLVTAIPYYFIISIVLNTINEILEQKQHKKETGHFEDKDIKQEKLM